jgi:hypothetical protein
MDKLLNINENFLWASMLWGAIAGGYCLYGWKQRALLPFLCGLVMTAMSFIGPNALIMSLVCVVTMFVTHWLIKQGY